MAMKDAFQKAKKINTGTFSWVFARNREYNKDLILLTVLKMAESSLGVLTAVCTKLVIDSVTGGDSAGFTRSVILLLAVSGGTLGLTLWTQHLDAMLEAGMIRSLQMRFVSGLFHSDYQALSGYPSGELISRINHDTGIINSVMRSVLPSMLSLLVSVGLSMIVLSQVSPVFAWGMLGIVLVGIVGYIAINQYYKGMVKRISGSSDRIAGFLHEVVEKVLIVQALNVVEATERKADDLMGVRWGLQRKMKNFSLLTTGVVMLFSTCLSVGTLLWGAIQVLHGRITFGTLASTVELTAQMSAPFFTAPVLLKQFICLGASVERLQELENIPKQAQCEKRDAAQLYSAMETLDAEHLSFAYDSREPVMEDVSFSIPKGTLTVIVGTSGEGKSTLLKLLLGVYRPGQGRLVFRGREDVTVDLGSRDMFTYAPQGNLLLSGTIRDNLLFSCPDATEEEIQRAVYISAMDDYLDDLPDGLDTPLGENAGGLSEGQAQRVSIARAVLSRAPILLLDEITSALDGETERKVLARLTEMKDHTCIAVTHRPAILDMADVVLRVTDGKIEQMNRKEEAV